MASSDDEDGYTTFVVLVKAEAEAGAGAGDGEADVKGETTLEFADGGEPVVGVIFRGESGSCCFVVEAVPGRLDVDGDPDAPESFLLADVPFIVP